MSGLQSGEHADELIEQVHELLAERPGIEQTGDRAQQVAEQIARAGLRRDVEYHLIQVDDQTEQIEVERS